MKVNLFLTTFLLIPTLLLSQSDVFSNQYYNEGLKAFNNEDYRLADSLFSLSILYNPSADAYFNRALSKKQLNDFSGYCLDLFYSSRHFDKEADSIFWAKCGNRDSVIYDSYDNIIDSSQVLFKEVFESCDLISYYRFREYNFKLELLLSYEIFNNDTFYLNGLNLIKPSFPQGEDGLFKYLGTNIKYPENAKRSGKQGTVYVSFIINETGRVNDIKILKSPAESLSDEAHRVISNMPFWIPGSYNERNVKVQYYLPIRFTLK